MASRTLAAPPRTRLPDPRTTGNWTARVPHYSSMVLAIYSALLVTWSVLPFLRGPMRIPREYVHTYFFGAPDTSLAWAMALGLLAAALAARKRVAWWLLSGYMAVFAVVNVVQYLAGLGVHAVVAMGIHLLAVGALLLARRQFSTRVRRAALWRALATLFGGWFLAVMVGWGLVELFPETLIEPRFWWAFWRVTAIGAATTSDRLLFDGHPAGWVNMLLGGFGMVVMLATVSALFRSQRDDNAITGIDESAIRYLLAESHPADSLGYFATRRDKAVVFSPNGQAAICYRVEAGICLASADPIGPQHAWDQVITTWRARCVQYGWEPAVIGASQAAAAAYARAGLTVLHLGDEAVVTASTLRYLTSPALKPVRQAVSRARRAGLTVRVRRHRDLTAKEMARTCQLAADWRDTDTERGFSMALGRMGDPFDGECLLVEAVNEHGAVVGILSFVPWGDTGASLDVMRRSPTAPGGVVEFMITEFAAAADGFGINKLSLNFAVMRSVFADGAKLGAGPVLRAWRALLILGSRWWQLETLYRSNAKYRPDWVPRYLCFDDARHLPRVSLAAGICEGFVKLPWRRSDGDGLLHTGTHPSVPPALLASGLLHTDGRAPDVPIRPPQPTVRRPEQVRVRIAKLSTLSAAGIDPYPPAQPPTHSIEEARRQPAGTTVRIAGRILRLRDLGGVVFAVLRDFSGEVQVLVDSGQVGRARTRQFARLDIGDLLSASGTMGTSRSGEWSVLASKWRLDAKCLHPLPNKWKGLTDPETRVRQRYVDLAVNIRARTVLRQRSAIVAALRDTLNGHDFLEVETPILQQVHGGANAAPFLTHINAYNMDLYLRIAPELYLKRLCVAGVDKVFEIGRVFRNEGVSFKHNPEFTILEAYAAHGDYQTMRKLSQELIQTAARAAHGSEIIRRPGPDGQPVDIDISGDWPVKTFHSAVSEALGVMVGPDTPLAQLRELCDAHDIAYQASWDAGAVLLEIYENLVEHRTEFPTFYTDFPLSVSPLTRPHPDKPGVAAKWDLVAWGVELGTAYSELTDPVDQRERLTQQSLLAAGGDPEAMELDEDFLRALEHGMPPTGGLGIGVDRVVMLITGCGIRESLPFPLARPHT